MTIVEDDLVMTDYDALLADLWRQPEDKVDFKKPFRLDLASKKEVYGLVKDILGLSNRAGGGFIVIGREDGTRAAIDCDVAIIKSFDTTKVHDQVKSYGKPEPIFKVYSGNTPEGTKAIIIHVLESDIPVICAKNATLPDEKGPPILRAGAIYIRSRTGNAQTSEIATEQDMRDLIDRAILKGGKKLTSAIDLLISRYVQGDALDPLAQRESIQNWQDEEALIDKELTLSSELSDPLLHLAIHPIRYEKNLFDSKTLVEKVADSCFFHLGWSFPFPNFEITKDTHNPVKNGYFTHTSSKRYADCELESVFGVTTAGLVIYKEELTSAYDTNRSGKPFLVLQAFLTAYRAVGFLRGFYDFIPEVSELKIKLIISNTYHRIPCTRVYLPLDHPEPFFKATEMTAPKIFFDLTFTRGEVSSNPIGATFRIAKKIVDFTNAKISDTELYAEVEKIAKLT